MEVIILRILLLYFDINLVYLDDFLCKVFFVNNIFVVLSVLLEECGIQNSELLDYIIYQNIMIGDEKFFNINIIIIRDGKVKFEF